MKDKLSSTQTLQWEIPNPEGRVELRIGATGGMGIELANTGGDVLLIASVSTPPVTSHSIRGRVISGVTIQTSVPGGPLGEAHLDQFFLFKFSHCGLWCRG